MCESAREPFRKREKVVSYLFSCTAVRMTVFLSMCESVSMHACDSACPCEYALIHKSAHLNMLR